jgi:hypothetical protein
MFQPGRTAVTNVFAFRMTRASVLAVRIQWYRTQPAKPVTRLRRNSWWRGVIWGFLAKSNVRATVIRQMARRYIAEAVASTFSSTWVTSSRIAFVDTASIEGEFALSLSIKSTMMMMMTPTPSCNVLLEVASVDLVIACFSPDQCCRGRRRRRSEKAGNG